MSHLYLLLLVLLSLERVVELIISNRNAQWSFARGGVEYGQMHFRWMRLLHIGFLLGCAGEVLLFARPFVPVLGFSMLAVALAAQALRYWAIATLGHYWNVRIIVLPDTPAIGRGPYQYIRHPNYLAVIAEGIAIPLIHSAWITAAIFTVLNAWLLTVRIRCEEQALVENCDYAAQLAGRRWFFPRRVQKSTTGNNDIE